MNQQSNVPGKSVYDLFASRTEGYTHFGGFQTAVFDAYRKGDLPGQKKIADAFPEWFAPLPPQEAEELTQEEKEKIKSWVTKEIASYREEAGSDYMIYLIEDAIGQLKGWKRSEDFRKAVAEFVRKVVNE